MPVNDQWLLRGGRVLDPSRDLDGVADLGIRNGLLVDPSELTSPQLIDCEGQYILPGLIDLSTHFGEPGDEQAGTIASESAAAAAGGITTAVHRPDTDPIVDTPAVAALLQRKAEATGRLRIVPVGAWTAGLHGEHLSEMHALLSAGCVAMGNADQPIANLQVLRNALKYAATYGLALYLHPLEAHLSTNGCAHDGEVAVRLGLSGLPSAAESIAVSAVIELVRECGAQVHLSRISCAASVSLIEQARAEGLPISADCAIANLYLSEADLTGYDANMHLQPPLRSQRDQQLLRRALAAGIISAVCSDHFPKDADAKAGAFCQTEPGAIGMQTLLPLVWRLGEELGASALQRTAWLTTGPARSLGLETPTLAMGSQAELLIFDPRIEWELNAGSNRSAACNSPFWGWTFHGRPSQVFFAGRPLLDSDGAAL